MPAAAEYPVLWEEAVDHRLLLDFNMFSCKSKDLPEPLWPGLFSAFRTFCGLCRDGGVLRGLQLCDLGIEVVD